VPSTVAAATWQQYNGHLQVAGENKLIGSRDAMSHVGGGRAGRQARACKQTKNDDYNDQKYNGDDI